MPYTGTNYAPMFQDGIANCSWGDAKYHNGDAYYSIWQAGTIDYNNLSPNGNPSLRYLGEIGEIDGYPFPVSVGDRVIFSCWIKTGSVSGHTVGGARISCDMYAGGQIVDGLAGATYSTFDQPPIDHPVSYFVSSKNSLKGWNVGIIDFGHDWVQMIYDVIVPSDYYTNGGQLSPRQIDSFFPVLDCRDSVAYHDAKVNNGYTYQTAGYGWGPTEPPMWFADSVLYHLSPNDPYYNYPTSFFTDTVTSGINISPTSGLSNSFITLTGSGFTPYTVISATFNGSSLTLNGNRTIDSAGNIATGVNFAVPALSPNTYNVVVTDGVNSFTTTFTITAPSNTIGGTTFNDGDDCGWLEGYSITVPTTGTITSIGINIANANGYAIVGIYSTISNNRFAGLLRQSASTFLANGWNNIPITPLAVTQGVQFYLALTTSGTTTRFYNNHSDISHWVAFTYGALPDPSGVLTTSSIGNCDIANMSINYTTNVIFTRAILDIVGYLDSKTKHKNKVRLLLERIGILDTKTKVKSINRTFTEVSGYLSSRLTDLIVSGVHRFTRTINESIEYSSGLSKVKSLVRNFFEPIGNLDIVKRVRKLFSDQTNTDNPFIIYYEET
jgi:hypothetical protein